MVNNGNNVVNHLVFTLFKPYMIEYNERLLNVARSYGKQSMIAELNRTVFYVGGEKLITMSTERAHPFVFVNEDFSFTSVADSNTALNSIIKDFSVLLNDIEKCKAATRGLVNSLNCLDDFNHFISPIPFPTNLEPTVKPELVLYLQDKFKAGLDLYKLYAAYKILEQK
jgi:hypothetical protein